MKGAASYTINISDVLGFKHQLEFKQGVAIVKRLPKGPTVRLPRRLLLTPGFAWAAGFYCAEGSHIRASIGVSNCYFPLLFKFRTELERFFGMDLPWHLIYRTKNLTQNGTRRIKETFGVNQVLSYATPLATNENVEMRANNIVLADVFHKVIEKILPALQKDRALSLYFLRGYEAGDGSINLRDRKCLHDINITVKDYEMKDLLKNLFYGLYKMKLNERKTKGAYEISFSDVEGMADLILDGHFKEHKPQWKKFLYGYMNKEYTRSHSRYWNSMRQSKVPQTIYEIATLSSRSHWSARDALNKDVRLGLIGLSSKKGEHGHPYKAFKLNEKGRRLIDVLEDSP